MKFSGLPLECTIYEPGKNPPGLTSKLEDPSRFSFFPLQKSDLTSSIAMFIFDNQNKDYFVGITCQSNVIIFTRSGEWWQPPANMDADEENIYLRTNKQQYIIKQPSLSPRQYPEISLSLPAENAAQYSAVESKNITMHSAGKYTFVITELAKNDANVRFYKKDLFYNVFTIQTEDLRWQRLLPIDIAIKPQLAVSGDQKMLYVFYGAKFQTFLFYDATSWARGPEGIIPVQGVAESKKIFIVNNFGTHYAIVFNNRIVIADQIGRTQEIVLKTPQSSLPTCAFLQCGGHNFLAITRPLKISIHLLGDKIRKDDIYFKDIIEAEPKTLNISFLPQNQIAFTVIERSCMLKIIVCKLPLEEIVAKISGIPLAARPAEYHPQAHLAALTLGAAAAQRSRSPSPVPPEKMSIAGPEGYMSVVPAPSARTASPKAVQDYLSVGDSPLRVPPGNKPILPSKPPGLKFNNDSNRLLPIPPEKSEGSS